MALGSTDRVIYQQSVAQTVKCLPAMWDTWVRLLGWEDPLEKGTGYPLHVLAWRIPWIG